ncbi:putative ABC transport system ATP-binding protein [Lachnospiraceae bacterium NE2001]|nr:putative ABC transport system ATP-binding protein [Lachnospiraceae bacterium NE2001]
MDNVNMAQPNIKTSEPMPENILTARDLVKAYPLGSGETLTVLDHVNYDFPKGRLIMLMGRSGSGKTTFMNLLSTLDDVTAGDIFYNAGDGSPEISYSQMSVGDKEKFRRYNIGFVFQSVALIPVMTAYENVDFGLRTANFEGNRDERIQEVLEKVGLADRAKHFPAELSGGERQRIAIARAMAHRPTILFADEPTGALDTTTGIYIAELFKNMTRTENLTVIMTTHDIRLSELADVLIQL